MNKLPFKNKNILVGICGSIAAYKAGILIRELRQYGANVRVVMTQSAQQFVTPLTFQALSQNPVEIDAFDGNNNDGMKHIQLAQWADMILIAPASANVCAKLANGLADDLLTMVCSASDKLLVLAPAMNRQMWEHPANQTNINTLIARKSILLGPASGDQACGENGEGRLLEPEQIVTELISLLSNGRLASHKVVITAGPTHEAIDPVRYISNHSSGKMGFELADAFTTSGAEVVLISGPVSLDTPANVQRVSVTSAEQMHQAALKEAKDADIFIGCAAVSDYYLETKFSEKIKHNENSLNLKLVPSIDIIQSVANQKHRPLMVGFAAETNNVESNAKAKILKKNLDIIFANQVGTSEDIGFGSDYNQVTAYWKGGEHVFEKMTKTILAQQISDLVIEHFQTYERNKYEDTA